MATIECAYCGKPTNGRARYCSTSCRVMFNRLPHRTQEIYNSVSASLDEVERILDKYPHLADKVIKQFTSLAVRARAHGDNLKSRPHTKPMFE